MRVPQSCVPQAAGAGRAPKTSPFLGEQGLPDSPPVREKSESPEEIRDAEIFLFCCKLRDVAFLPEIQEQEEKYLPDGGASLILVWVELNMYLRLLWKTPLQIQILLVTPTVLKTTGAPEFPIWRLGHSSDCTSVETGLQGYTFDMVH